MADVILVLTSGVQEDGSIESFERARVDKAIALVRDGVAPRMLISGYAPAHRTGVERTGVARTVQTMFGKHALEAGIPQEAVFEETHSHDTIGNFYFSQKICAANAWQSIAVVSSDFHLPRARYLAHKILGPAYILAFFSVESAPELFALKAAGEQSLLAMSEQLLEPLAAGDTAALEEVLFRLHPAFNGEYKR